MALILHLFGGSFLYAFHLYLIPFLVTPFLVMAVQPYLDLTPIKKLVEMPQASTCAELQMGQNIQE